MEKDAIIRDKDKMIASLKRKLNKKETTVTQQKDRMPGKVESVKPDDEELAIALEKINEMETKKNVRTSNYNPNNLRTQDNKIDFINNVSPSDIIGSRHAFVEPCKKICII